MLRSASLPILNRGDAMQDLYPRSELMDVVIRVEDRMEGREGGGGEELLGHGCVLAAHTADTCPSSSKAARLSKQPG